MAHRKAQKDIERSERAIEVVEQHHPASKKEFAKLCGLSVFQLTAALKYLRVKAFTNGRGVRVEYNGERWESTRENRNLAKYVDERVEERAAEYARWKVRVSK